jgi:hypothetical protein
MSNVIEKNTLWTINEHNLNFEISNIIEEVSLFNNEWFLDTSRQEDSRYHSKTKMFQVRFFPYFWSPDQNEIFEEVNSLKNEEAVKELNKLFNLLENYYDGKVVRCEIINMDPNSEIKPHVDAFEFCHYARRVHIPLITNKNVFFTVLNNTINMEVGKWYEINNELPHSVKNESNQNRVHIICDVLGNGYL